MGTNTALTILAVVVVVAVLALAAWVFVIAPIVVPLRHGRHHPQH
jgi:HAMP domain-containing protein